MSKIYIHVRGGAVNGVFSNNKKDIVELWDWDNIKAEVEDPTELEEGWGKLEKKLHSIF